MDAGTCGKSNGKPAGPTRKGTRATWLRAVARSADDGRGSNARGHAMSYDVEIGDFHANYTYNLSDLFRTHMDGGIGSLDGLKGSVALARLNGFFESVMREHIKLGKDQFREKYDAPNGWGSVDGALIFMARIMAACAVNPDGKVRVS